ncbi:MAG: Phenylalanine--tRNA ligase beta subunit [Methanomassiliicoccales archaeon PtaU1.Bin124]|nr:MAG: Phenylalanine--tRNA ligase beta subunit [Methanomassiliicoccales archaeon PtaU1.Bin124]
MPVINFNVNDLLSQLGEERKVEEVLDRIPMIGASLDKYDPSTGEASVEFFPNRPDLYSVEGVARAMRAFLDIKTGMRHYDVTDSGLTLTVDPSVAEIRPYIVAGAVKDVTMDDALIRSLMELQEKLHLTVGRKRSKVAIGVHDLDKVKGPFVYKGAEPDSISFVPLAKTEPMTLREVLDKHEKGVDYKHLVEGKPLFPVILDKDGELLSFPPIINGALTTVTDETKNIFIDVTGTDLHAVSGVLNIVSTSIAERGGRIQTVKLKGGALKTTPDLKSKVKQVDIAYANSWLGLHMDGSEMCSWLARMGYDSEAKGKNLHVQLPPWRMDILHQADIVEDLAIGYGYEKFGKVPPRCHTVAKERPQERAADLVRQLMVGYGFWEVTTLTLTNREDLFDKMLLPQGENVVEVLNPVTEDHNCLRTSLMPSLLAVLRKSKHRDLPQRIFEVGDVVLEAKRHKHICVLSIHSKASFTEIKSVLEGFMRDISAPFDLIPTQDGTYLPGRGAQVVFENEAIGTFGELHPEVIINFELGYPIVGFELDLDRLVKDKADKLL